MQKVIYCIYMDGNYYDQLACWYSVAIRLFMSLIRASYDGPSSSHGLADPFPNPIPGP
jgi:hypothetical protein